MSHRPLVGLAHTAPGRGGLSARRAQALPVPDRVDNNPKALRVVLDTP
ncbi:MULTISPECIES: hypothetical protein [Streptomyces]